MCGPKSYTPSVTQTQDELKPVDRKSDRKRQKQHALGTMLMLTPITYKRSPLQVTSMALINANMVLIIR